MRSLKILTSVLLLTIINSGCEAQELVNLMTNKDKKDMVKLINEARERGVYCGGKWRKAVEQAVDTWLKSEGHCRNMMKPEFTHFGAAKYGTYWTQIFATPPEK